MNSQNNTFNEMSLFSYNPNNEEYSVDKKNKFYFSYSKFSLYRECPLRYKFRYIDVIPEKPKPYLVFGRILHEILAHFFSRVPPPPLSELIEMFEEKWDSITIEEKGYLKPEYDRMDLNKGIRIINNFYQRHKDNDKLPVKNEYQTFVDVSGIVANIIVDRIDYLGDGKIDIVDYKTGSDKSRTSDQLYFYQKICEMDTKLVELINKKYRENLKKIEVHSMKYYYIETLKEQNFIRADENVIEKFWSEVLSTVRNIEDKKFDPAPGKNCEWCDYKGICPVFNGEKEKRNSKLIDEYISISNKIFDLEIRKKEIEKEIIETIPEKITYDTRTIKKVKTYEFVDRDEIIKLIKEYGFYEKILKPTQNSIVELIESDETPKELKEKLLKNVKTTYKIVME